MQSNHWAHNARHRAAVLIYRNVKFFWVENFPLDPFIRHCHCSPPSNYWCRTWLRQCNYTYHWESNSLNQCTYLLPGCKISCYGKQDDYIERKKRFSVDRNKHILLVDNQILNLLNHTYQIEYFTLVHNFYFWHFMM